MCASSGRRWTTTTSASASLTQEVDSLRQSLQQMAARPVPVASDPAAAAASGVALPRPRPLITPLRHRRRRSTPRRRSYGMRPTPTTLPVNTISRSRASRPTSRRFPKSDRADDAQVLICGSYLNDNKNDKAAQACDLAIRNYPGDELDPRGVLPQGARAAQSQGCRRRPRCVGSADQELSGQRRRERSRSRVSTV